MSGVWLTNNMVSAVLPGLLSSHVGLTAARTSGAMLIESLTIVVAFPLFGMLSQRVGRRVFYVGYGLVITILGSAAYVAVLTVRAGIPRHRRPDGAGRGDGVGHVRSRRRLSHRAVPQPHPRHRLRGRLQPRARAPRLLRVLPDGARRVVPSFLDPVIVVAVGGLLVTLGGFLGPETRDVEMGRHECETSRWRMFPTWADATVAACPCRRSSSGSSPGSCSPWSPPGSDPDRSVRRAHWRSSSPSG